MKKLKDLQEFQEPSIWNSKKFDGPLVPTLCKNPEFPEELKPLCKEPNAPQMLHRLGECSPTSLVGFGKPEVGSTLRQS